jgi:hypothetical protein
MNVSQYCFFNNYRDDESTSSSIIDASVQEHFDVVNRKSPSSSKKKLLLVSPRVQDRLGTRSLVSQTGQSHWDGCSSWRDLISMITRGLPTKDRAQKEAERALFGCSKFVFIISRKDHVIVVMKGRISFSTSVHDDINPMMLRRNTVVSLWFHNYDSHVVAHLNTSTPVKTILMFSGACGGRVHVSASDKKKRTNDSTVSLFTVAQVRADISRSILNLKDLDEEYSLGSSKVHRTSHEPWVRMEKFTIYDIIPYNYCRP